MTDQGERLEVDVAIEAEILGYYQRILGTDFVEKRDASDVFSRAITKKVPQHMKEWIICKVANSEIWKALQSIKRDKAPRPNDYNSAFFLDNWDVVKKDLVAGVRYFFEYGFLSKGWNATAVTLVPKKDAPSSIKDYKPIACYNTIYKCITKILANRLQATLPCLIRPSQSVSFKRRSIVDNVTVSIGGFRWMS